MNQNALQSDSEKSKHHKSMMYILQQAVNVCRWVNEFDPQNVNIEDLYLPHDLKQLNEYSHTLVKDFPKLDQVAELALRKFKVRAGAIPFNNQESPKHPNNHHSSLGRKYQSAERGSILNAYA